MLALIGSEGRGQDTSLVLDSSNRLAEHVMVRRALVRHGWLAAENPIVVAGELIAFFKYSSAPARYTGITAGMTANIRPEKIVGRGTWITYSHTGQKAAATKMLGISQCRRCGCQ